MDELNELFNDLKGIIQEIDNFEWKSRKDQRQAKHIIKEIYRLKEKYKGCKVEKIKREEVL